MNRQSARGRGAAAIVASMALMGTAAAATTSPAQSAAPVGDCAAPYPVANLSDGMAVHGLTVSNGTAPEAFSGEILGVLNDGIAPGLDMVMAELTSPAIDKAGGIWAGMSGSPVYVGDQLVGAVAYGLSWGSTPVAGITPFEDMDDYLGAAPVPARIEVSDRQARKIAEDSEVTARQASGGFRQLPMAISYSGVSASRLRQVKRTGPDYLDLRGTRAMGAAAAADVGGEETLVAGGNLGAGISYGDVTAGGVGTVTSVCGDRLVGFGHPMDFTGDAAFGLMPAEAVYVQPDPLGVAYKVANMGLPVGTIDQDRLTGISGHFEGSPPETLMESLITKGDRSREGWSRSMVPDYNADVLFFHLLANHDRVVDAIQGGSETASHQITGTDKEGAPFSLSLDDRYTSRWDISYESTFDVANVVWRLSGMNGVTVDEVSSEAGVTNGKAAWRIDSVQQRRAGTWVRVDRKNPAVTKRGARLELRANLVRGDRTERVPLTVRVPERATRRGAVDVRGGASIWDDGIWGAKNLDEMEQVLDGWVRNDQVQASLYFFKRGADVRVDKVSEPRTLVVRGGKWIEVKVRR